MKKRCGVVLLLLVIFTLVSGCGTDGDSGKTNNYVYNEFDIGYEEKAFGPTYFKDNKFYYIAYQDSLNWEEEIDGEYTDDGKLFIYDIETKENKEVCDIEGCSDLDDMIVTEDNQILLLDLSHGMDDTSIILNALSESGEKEEQIYLSENIKESFGEEEIAIENFYCIDGREVYVVCTDMSGKKYLVKSDLEGNITGNKIVYDEYVDGIVADPERNIVVVSRVYDGLKYSYANFETGMIEKTLELANEKDVYRFTGNDVVHSSIESASVYTGYGDETFFVRDTQGLCSYDEKKQQITYMFDWVNVGLIGSFVKDIKVLDDGRMLCVSRDNMGSCSFGILEEKKEGEKRIKLRCAILDTEQDFQHSIEKNIIEYNRQSEDYYVELVSYEKSDSPIGSFAQDILSGNVPDIIVVHGIDMQSYINQGLFEDLAPYMNADDVLNKDYYIDGLYDAMTVDDKCYYAIKDLKIQTMVAKASETEQYNDGWTIEEMDEYRKSKPDVLFDLGNCKMSVYQTIGQPFLDRFIDWKSGETRFDSEEFRKMLEFCNNYPNEDSSMDSLDNYLDIMNNEKVLVYDAGFNGLGYGGIFEAYAVYKNDVRYIGFPSEEKIKAYITPGLETLAMSSASEHKEAAWDFIKFSTTNQYYNDIDLGSLTSSADIFEKHLKQLSVTEKTTDEDGVFYKPLEGSGAINDFPIPQFPLKKDEINELRNMFKESVIYFENESLNMIVEPIVLDYFEERKTLDEVVEVLQDRVGKYVNENR